MAYTGYACLAPWGTWRALGPRQSRGGDWSRVPRPLRAHRAPWAGSALPWTLDRPGSWFQPRVASGLWCADALGVGSRARRPEQTRRLPAHTPTPLANPALCSCGTRYLGPRSHGPSCLELQGRRSHSWQIKFSVGLG